MNTRDGRDTHSPTEWDHAPDIKFRRAPAGQQKLSGLLFEARRVNTKAVRVQHTR